ncbi:MULTISPECIES: esterase/lipase family protein [unclassified Streptomyces]|uniref:esterase/lipase family protein n=1 Tax=unclassified Streptomyces TaxID=2593676 RepID=UPI001661EEA2|nr:MULTISPECIES: alpha/beta fold hydrolase [unclassified Streptomyces]MBD0839451.1 alpha/beta fold hydrolase [Streptomyces sp. TRM68416]
MQRHQRRLTLLLSVVLATVVTMFTVTPAAAAPTRTNSNQSRVIFVHGFAPTGKHSSCSSYFSKSLSHFKDKGWRGSLLTFGYYRDQDGCSKNYPGSRDTSLKTVAKAFANYVHSYSKNNIKVDVVAHSMGGLVVRAALHYTRTGASGFPSYLYIEDVVTLGSPHGGTGWGTACSAAGWQQCKDMKPGSAFLNALGSRMPDSRMGTDWTTIGSYDDGVVSETSAVAGVAEHEWQYHGDANLSHGDLKTVSTGSYRARKKTTTNGATWSAWGSYVSPVSLARTAVFYHSSS